MKLWEIQRIKPEDEYEKCIRVHLRIAKKRKRIPVVKERRPKFEFVSASIQKPSHGMKQNLVGELCMY